MPMYIFQNPKTNEEVEVFFHMDDEKKYFDKDGLEWKRVFTVPHASIDTKLDAFDKNGFIEKSGKMQGTVGDMLDYSAELSQERAERSETGEDPIKRKNFDDYEKRNGKKHLSDVKKTIETSKIRVDLD